QELQTSLELAPKSANANRALAAFYISTGRGAKAEPYMKTFADITATVGAKLALADFYTLNGRDKDAIAVLEPLTKDKDGFVPATARLARFDYQAKRKDQASKTVDDILKRAPRNELGLITKARFQINDRNYAEALKLANSIVEANQQNVTAHYIRGAALEATGSIDESIKSFLKVL